jgi:hypothetical protein
MPWRRSPPEFSGGSRQAVEMTVCGKHGKTMKPFSHPSHSPWKSLRRFPHSHRHDDDEDEFYSPNPAVKRYAF